MSDLNELLKQQAGAGEHDSTGRFTLDPARARELLAGFRMRRPEDCLLKWIQAAVLARSLEIRLQLGRDSTVLTAVDCRVSLNEHRLQEALSRPLERSKHPERHLAIGLLAAWKSHPARLSVTWPHGHLEFHGTEITRGEGSGESLRIEWSRRLTGGFWERFRRLLKGHLRETTTLAQARYAVSPVLLDSRPLSPDRTLSTPVHDDGSVGSLVSGWPLLVALLPAPAGDPRALVWRNASRGVFRRNTRYRVTAAEAGCIAIASTGPLRSFFRPSDLQTGETPPVWLRLELQMPLTGTGRVIFVQDGVILEEKRLSLGIPGAVAWVSCSGLDTDLSEFRLVENDEYHRLLAGIRSCLLETVNRVGPQLRTLLARQRPVWMRLVKHVPALRPLTPERRKTPRPPADPLPRAPRELKPNDRRQG